jgi:hypothetical protein
MFDWKGSTMTSEEFFSTLVGYPLLFLAFIILPIGYLFEDLFYIFTLDFASLELSFKKQYNSLL